MHKKYQSKIRFLTRLFWLKRVPSSGKLKYTNMGGDFFSHFLKGGDFVNVFGKPCSRLIKYSINKKLHIHTHKQFHK